MGTDKALLEIDGVALAQRVHAALVTARCAPVWAIGGDAARLRLLGLHVVADRFPGEGPLGALVTALAALGSEADVVVVLACDLPDADPRAISALCAPFTAPGGDLVDVVLPRSNMRRHMHHAAWRVTSLPLLVAAFDAGERAPRRALGLLRVHELAVGGAFDPAWLVDVDEPGDLRARRARSPGT